MRQNVWHIVGPPGTGKTTTIARRAKATVEKRGAGSIVIASLTRAAAAEIGARDTGVDPDQVGTLHALCFHALGRPDLAEGKKIDDWNRECPSLALSKSNEDADDGVAGTGDEPGDESRALLDRLRARLVPEDAWPIHVRHFYGRWRAWKECNGLYDFTDLLTRAVEEVPEAPGSPSVLLGDEAQDWSPLEAHLFRDVWGAHAETVVLVGDVDQSIYGFRGADPRIFMDSPAPEGQHSVLSQSYRVPRAIHAAAQRVIRTVHDREDVLYRPRDEDGSVEHLCDTFYDPDRVVRILEDCFERRERVLLLASCGYMLEPTIKILRERGVPFCNPYRRKRGDWNPLRPATRDGKRKTVTASDRVLAFLAAQVGDRDWTREEVARWIEKLSVEKAGLVRGAKTRVRDPAFNPSTDFLSLFAEPEIGPDGTPKSASVRAAIEGDLSWFRRSVLDSGGSSLRFAARVAEKHGHEALAEDSPVMVGTIHSVKGGEADTVILFPDVSRRDMEETPHDERARRFYVGMTRARKRLILCDAASDNEAGFW